MKGILGKIGLYAGAIMLSATLAGCEYEPGPPIDFGDVPHMHTGEELDDIINRDKPAAIAIHRTGCTACPAHIDTFLDVAPEFEGELYPAVLEGDDVWGRLGADYGVTCVPVTLCFWQGEEYWEYAVIGGYARPDQFRDGLEGCAALDD